MVVLFERILLFSFLLRIVYKQILLTVEPVEESNIKSEILFLKLWRIKKLASWTEDDVDCITLQKNQSFAALNCVLSQEFQFSQPHTFISADWAPKHPIYNVHTTSDQVS